jgi:hypothetical protein
MAATFVSAGVYIQEKDNSLYAPALAPTIIGIIGTATKGALNTATLVTNEGQLIDTFGDPQAKDLGMHAAIEALKACRLVYFVRIAGAALNSGTISASDAGSAATTASIGPSTSVQNFNLMTGSVEAPHGTRTATFRITYDDGGGVLTINPTIVGVQAHSDSVLAGAYNLNAIDGGNPTYLTLKVDAGVVQTITFDVADPIIVANGGYAALTAAGAAHVINSQLADGYALYGAGGVLLYSDTYGSDSSVEVTGGNANVIVNGFDFDTTVKTSVGNTCGNFTTVHASEVETAIELPAVGDIACDVGLTGTVTFHTVTTGAAKSIRIVSANSSAIGASPLINLAPLDVAVLGTNAGAAAPTISFTAKTGGSHSSNISVRISTSTALTGTKKVEILYKGVVVETYDKLYKSPTPVTGGYAMVATINSGNTTAGFDASLYVTAASLSAPGENPVDGTYTLAAGANGDNWTAGSVVGTISGTTRTGMQIFRDPEQIYINVLATPGISYASVIAEGLDLCANRSDCLYVADCPIGLSPANAVKWHNGDNTVTVTVDQEARTGTNSTAFNSSYGALYYPFVQVFDGFTDADIWLPPSAIALRTIAFTDEVADPWFAPAGPNRTQALSVLDLEYSATLGERDLMQLTGNNVNPIANIAGVGVVIMGQKTMQKATTALDRVNVRRLLLLAEKLVAQSVFFLTFEQNDSVMWRRFVNLVSPIFDDIKARRGLYDFRIVADSSTTTSTLINQNTFLGKIFLQPTKSAEKLIVAFNLVPTGANFEEFAQS